MAADSDYRLGEAGKMGEADPRFSLSGEHYSFTPREFHVPPREGAGVSFPQLPASPGPTLSPVDLLREAKGHGILLAVRGSLIEWHAREAPSPDLLDRLRAAKPELVAILKGNSCKICGCVLRWPSPVGVVYGDGTASCMACHAVRCEAPPRLMPKTVANCRTCRKVRALDAERLCAACAKENKEIAA
jgi:hypothetical protein